MTTWCSTQTPPRSHGENKSSGRRRRRSRCGGGVRRAVCEHHPLGQERSRFTQMSPHFIHSCESCALSPYNRVMMMSRGLQKNASKKERAKRERLRNLFRVYIRVRKTEAYEQRRDRFHTTGGFFASFGDFFPAPRVPTISEHLLALSLLKRSAYLRDSKEKNARRDFRRTHVSQYFCPRERE